MYLQAPRFAARVKKACVHTTESHSTIVVLSLVLALERSKGLPWMVPSPGGPDWTIAALQITL